MLIHVLLYVFTVFTWTEGLLEGSSGLLPQSPTSDQTMMLEILKLQETVTDLTARISQLEAKDQSVAFFAYLGNDIVNPTAGQTVVFNETETNVGNGYDPAHGVFTAPVSGTYHFAFVGSSPPQSSNHGMHIFMMKNGEKEAYIFFDANTQYWIQRGSSSVLRLATGDRVWMEVGSASGSNLLAGHRHVDNAYHSHFSGFLINSE